MSAAVAPSIQQLEAELRSDIGSFTHDPFGLIRYAFPWGEKSLSKSAGPRTWQANILDVIKEHLGNPETRFQPLKVAVSSGHGIGKSALVAMVINWAQSTCEDCKVVVTAGTGVQLATKTAPETQKWFRLAINSHWWDINATSIRVKDDDHQANWRTDFITWSEHNTEAFAGLHNQGKRILLVFDEASAIHDRVWDVAEGALTDENTEIIWLAFGNPTQNTGKFKECFHRLKHRWKHFRIDSRTVEGTNKAEINKWIEDYGEDSDFVRVRVRGEFPRAGTSQFIPVDAVAEARKYKAADISGMPKILGVDVARFGDDQTVFVLRQGRKASILGKYRGLDTAQVTAQCIDYITKHDPDAVVVDSDGIGAPVYDQLKFQGYAKHSGSERQRLYEFHGGKPANDQKAYFNQRSEIWGQMRDWIVASAEIPDDPELETDLTGPEYGFSAQNQLQLEKKDDMKKRGLSSPDIGDALAMTFAVKILPKPRPKPPQKNHGARDSGLGWMGS